MPASKMLLAKQRQPHSYAALILSKSEARAISPVMTVVINSSTRNKDEMVTKGAGTLPAYCIWEALCVE